jgi:tetratricopeptide (TPR) repeat protein
MHAARPPRCYFSLAIATTCLAVTATGTRATSVVSEFDELPAPFVAGKTRNEAAAEHIEALAHFAAGRTFQQRGEFARAVKEYARANRLDPTASAARTCLVVAAIQENRFALAARYATKGIDAREVRDAIVRLASYLAEQGDLANATALYEKALEAPRGKNAADGSSGDLPKSGEDAADLFVRLELGRMYHLAQQYSKSAEQFARVNDALEHPDRFGISSRAKQVLLGKEAGELYELFGEAFLLTDRWADAEAAFRKSHSVSPRADVLKYNLARVATRRDRLQEALAGLESCLGSGLASKGPAPYELLADVLKKLGKESELMDRLQKLRATDPTNASLSYLLADVYLKAGQTDMAEPLYRELSAKTPTVLAYRNLAEIYRKSGQYSKLLTLLGKVTTATGTLEVLGPETKRLNSDADLFAKLVEAGRKRIRDATAKVESSEFSALAILAQEHKQHETANEFFELALKAEPSKSAEFLLVWGIGLLLDERPAEAVKVFQRGLDTKVLPEGNPVFQFYLAGALAACNRLEPAVAAARVAAERKGDSARFASRLPWVLFRARRYDEARKAYEELFAKFGGEKDSLETLAVLREARVSMSALCVVQGRLDEAEEWLQQVLDEYPDDVEANNDLGYLWADSNRHLGRALKMIVAAVAAEPENRAYRDSLGWIFFRLGRFAEAVAELEKAVDDKLPDGTVLEHLGDAYEKLGRHNAAVTAWQRAKAAYQKDQESDKAKRVGDKADGKSSERMAKIK